MVNSITTFAGKSNASFFEHTQFCSVPVNKVYIFCHLKPLPRSFMRLVKMLSAPGFQLRVIYWIDLVLFLV